MPPSILFNSVHSSLHFTFQIENKRKKKQKKIHFSIIGFFHGYISISFISKFNSSVTLDGMYLPLPLTHWVNSSDYIGFFSTPFTFTSMCDTGNRNASARQWKWKIPLNILTTDTTISYFRKSESTLSILNAFYWYLNSSTALMFKRCSHNFRIIYSSIWNLYGSHVSWWKRI